MVYRRPEPLPRRGTAWSCGCAGAGGSNRHSPGWSQCPQRDPQIYFGLYAQVPGYLLILKHSYFGLS